MRCLGYSDAHPLPSLSLIKKEMQVSPGAGWGWRRLSEIFPVLLASGVNLIVSLSTSLLIVTALPALKVNLIIMKGP